MTVKLEESEMLKKTHIKELIVEHEDDSCIYDY